MSLLRFLEDIGEGFVDFWNSMFGRMTLGAMEDIPVVGGFVKGAQNYLDKQEAKEQHLADQEWSEDMAVQDRMFQHEERLSTEQYNLDMWNLANEYNHPANEIARAKEAGINVNSLFGNGSMSGTVSPPSPSRASPGAMAAMVQSIAPGLLTAGAMQDQLRSQSQLNNADTEAKKFGLSFDKMTADVRYKALQANVDKQYKEIEQIAHSMGIADFNKDLAHRSFEHLVSMDETRREQMYAELDKMRAEYDEILQKIEFSKTEQKYILKQIDVADSVIDLNNANASLIEQQEETEKRRTTLVGNQSYSEFQQGQILTLEKQLKQLEEGVAQKLGVPPGTPEFMLNFMLFKEGKTRYFYNRLIYGALESLISIPGSIAQTFAQGIKEVGVGRRLHEAYTGTNSAPMSQPSPQRRPKRIVYF